MLFKTSGILLHSVKYSDTSLIVKIFSSDFGLKSYIVNASRNKKSKIKASLFQPLALVEIIVSNTEKAKLERISEINIITPYTNIPYNIIKSTITLFLNEILYRAIKEQQNDINLFEFIKNSLLLLDLKQENCSNFHVFFMIQLSRYLGFFPEGSYSISSSIFDLQEGRFINHIPNHPFYLNEMLSNLFYQFITSEYNSIHKLKLDKMQRKALLKALIKFYQLHIASFGEIKSFEILEEIIA